MLKWLSKKFDLEVELFLELAAVVALEDESAAVVVEPVS